MKHDIKRKKLNKLIGKTLSYEATFLRLSDDNKRALLLDITHNGKCYTDHAWVSAGHTLKALEPKERIKFNGEAHTYTDSHGERKNGLTKCRNYHITNESLEKTKEDGGQRYLRCNR